MSFPEREEKTKKESRIDGLRRGEKKRAWEQDRATVLFLGYAVVLCFLLFCRKSGLFDGRGYLEMLKENYSVIPFATIKYYLKILSSASSVTLEKNAVVNLVGNVIMFIPPGVYLPHKFPFFRRFISFFCAVVLMIAAVELIQFFTLLGYCDIDDLILNVFGAVIGFLGYKALKRS